MKKLFFNLLLAAIPICMWSQEKNGIETFAPVNTPNAMAFSSVNFAPISEYTGKVNLTVPIYEIDLDGLKIPIALKYSYGGVKVNSIASDVGMNWSLSAGGSVIKEINGVDDYSPDPEAQGYMVHQYIVKEQQDMYYVSAPGINTSFITVYDVNSQGHGLVNQTKEITKQGNKITTKAFRLNGLEPDPTAGNLTLDTGEVNVIATNGFEYTFSNINKIELKTRNINWHNGVAYGLEAWNWRYPNWVSSLDVTSIKTPKGNEVTFEYEYYGEGSEYSTYKGVFNTDGSLKTQITTHTTDKNKRIKKITFQNGTVEFFYNFLRKDIYHSGVNQVNNAAALDRILIKNIHGQIIKDARLVYSNVQSVESCTEEECYRLFLDEIYYTDAFGNTVPGHKFEYNSTKLPKRYSYRTDFLGYYNGVIASPPPSIPTHYIPKTFYKANQGKDSYLPLNIGGSGYQALNGNFSLASNETYAKAGILEKVTYPTGGYTIFESENNQFKYNGVTVNGGGLRIKNQKIYDFDNTLQRQINYDYSLSDGSTSGSISYMPRFNSYNLSVTTVNSASGGGGFGIYQSDMANQKTTESSYVGYSRVKISESNNGYIIKEFTSPADFPNILSTVEKYRIDPPLAPPYIQTVMINDAIDDGCFPNIITNKDIFRGKLKKEYVYSKTNTLVQKTENNYEYKDYETIPISNRINYTDPAGDGSTVEAYLAENANLLVERNLVKNSLQTSYNIDGTQVSAFKEYTYENEYPFIKEERITNSDRSDMISKYFYPFNPPTFDLASVPKWGNCEGDSEITQPLNELVNKNIISSPYYKQSFKNSDLIRNTLTLFKKFPKLGFSGNPTGIYMFNGTPISNRSITNNKLILTPTNQFGNPIYECDYLKNQTGYIIHQYDDYGNPIEVSANDDSARTILVWGYNGKHLIAKIENATLKNIPFLDKQKIGSVIAWSNTENSSVIENNMRNELINMVSSSSHFSKSRISIYTYDPLIGMTSMTDTRGYIIYYEYDSFNRLSFVKNQDGHVISENRYNYKN